MVSISVISIRACTARANRYRRGIRLRYWNELCTPHDGLCHDSFPRGSRVKGHFSCVKVYARRLRDAAILRQTPMMTRPAITAHSAEAMRSVKNHRLS